MPPKRIKGRYEIKSVLGEGGMGVVYRAFDPPPMNRDVALKTLLEFPDRMSLQLFYKECEVLKAMSHPNIVEIFDMGEFEDAGQKKPFFVMPLLPGQALDALIRDSSHRLSVERVVDIMSQACRGLQAAHERGLVHRDLKPSNLFVMEDDSVKIIDFGVAHTVDSRTRSSGFQKGTLLYMAPEQIQFKPVSPQSDIFSLGVVCYEAFTRRQPFRGSSEEDIVNAILKEIPPPASEINPAVNQTISRVVHKAMAKQPWNRFDSAREFGETLQKALRNQPIEIFDPSRIAPRIQRATKALDSGDYQFAADIVGELEAEGNIDPQLTLLRTQIDQVVRQRTLAQLLESARARYEEEEDPLALQKIQEILQLDPNNASALGLKSKIDDRRSERQIEKWLRLARQHIDNHSYSHAREALQNVMQLRPNESRARRMLSDIEGDEKEYLQLRQQKGAAYQAALNSWKNGEVSEALTQMGMVLELDREAPDSTSPETSAAYQNFYNKVRSEHDTINNGYAEARRALADRQYIKALNICQEFLAKYPNHALFQAFKFDVEEQQRQQVSAYIADVDRRLEAEPDLNAKVSLLREALAENPGEAHFERSLRLISDKRDLVNSIVARARAHEERGQINEGISDLEILRTIYSPYPGLQFEIDRLQKRREVQSRDSAKSRWMEQVERQLATGNFAKASELLQKAAAEFPNDTELGELEKRVNAGFQRAQQAEQLLAQGQELSQQGDLDQGLEILRQAHQLDDRNPVVLNALRDALVERARNALETDWRAAESFAAQALELDSSHALARSIRAQAVDQQREEVVARCSSQVRQLQAAGQLETAAAELKKGLSTFPSEPRLVSLQQSLNKEMSQTQLRQRRLQDLEQARELTQQAAAASDTDKLKSIFEQTRGFANKYPEEPELQTIAREVERIVKARGDDRPATPKAVPTKSPTPKPAPKQKSGRTAEARNGPSSSSAVLWLILAGSVVCFVAVGLLIWHFLPQPPKVVIVPIQIHTVPPGAALRINGKPSGTSDTQLDLPAGDYQLEASLPGYETVQKSFSAQAGASPVEISLNPLSEQVRIATPDLDSGKVFLGDIQVGSLESGALTLPSMTPGQHVLRIVPEQHGLDATITFQTAPNTMPVVDAAIPTHQLQVVVVSSAGGAVQIRSSLTGIAVSVDGKPSGQLGPDGLQISGLNPGRHELVLGENARTISFETGQAPALDAVVYADRDVGSMLILTSADDATVTIDGRPYPRKTQRGQLRIPNLRTVPHEIAVHKDGFKDPAKQTVSILKGKESNLNFALEPLPKLATLTLDHLPPNSQISLGDTPIGTVGPDGTLSYANVSPGTHSIVVAAPGYETERIEHKFSENENVHLSTNDLHLKHAQNVLEIIVLPNTAGAVMQGSRMIRQFNGPTKVPLDDGNYTVVTHGAGGVQAATTVTLAGGEPKTVDLRKPSTTTSSSGMDRWQPSNSWEMEGGWYVHHGGGLPLYDAAPGPGSYVFTLKLHFAHTPFTHSPRIRWVVGYKDKDNYTEMQLDSKFLYRSEFVAGKEQEFPKVPHKIPDNSDFVTISVDILPTTLTHRFNLHGTDWQTINVWDTTNAPSLYHGKPRTFTEGKFGFMVPDKRDIEISNFSFAPRR